MVDEKRKQAWIKKTIKDRMQMLSKHKCDKCGQVCLGVGSVIDMSFLCLDCMGDVLFQKPNIDLDDFAKI